MFGDFHFSDILDIIDTLVEKRRGSYEDFLNMTIRDLINIVNMVINKEREAQLKEHKGDLKNAEKVHKSPDADYEDVMKVMEANHK